MTKAKMARIRDFTIQEYVELLRIAKQKYTFTNYESLNQDNIVIWRHDCDYSLNRALRLAKLESGASVTSTFFINPHCEFYNILEKSQSRIIAELIELGHALGLHFDAEFYRVENEDQLDELVDREASYIESWFGVRPQVFSFHNPDQFLLSCEHDTYGGLVNAYSKTLKQDFEYCSDSNGYWRFNRLREVLEEGNYSKLHVLTHPGWWQEEARFPRERIFNCIYGRANSVMSGYDQALQVDKRENMDGISAGLRFLQNKHPGMYQLCDYLANIRALDSLFVELYRLHQYQLLNIATWVCHRCWHISKDHVDGLLIDYPLRFDARKFFEIACERSWSEICSYNSSQYDNWSEMCSDIVSGRTGGVELDQKLADECTLVSVATRKLSEWGLQEHLVRDLGMTKIDRSEISEEVTKTSGSDKNLTKLKSRLGLEN